jgi:hypothetical protein
VLAPQRPYLQRAFAFVAAHPALLQAVRQQHLGQLASFIGAAFGAIQAAVGLISRQIGKGNAPQIS